MKNKVIFVFSFLLLIGLTPFWMLGKYSIDLHPTSLVQKLVYRAGSMDDELKNLIEIYLLINKAYKDHKPPSINVVTQFLSILESMYPNISFPNNEKNISLPNNENANLTDENTSVTLDVCPEQWFKNIDRPFFQKGFVMSNCTNVRPPSQVISIVLHFENISDCKTHLPNILSGLRISYPSISVYVSGNILTSCSKIKPSKTIKSVPVKDSWKPGRIWNELIAAVTTPYALIGRDLNYFDNFSQIERQIRMISYSSDIAIAGGSQRNLSGHWKVGCYQSNLRNYILEYLDGYYMSRNECMFCDHLLGSFVTTKALHQKIPFDNDLPPSLVFEDFFLKVKSSRLGSVVNCPDAMYFSTNSYEDQKSNDRLLWIPLAKKWKINRILIPGEVKHSYSCIDIGIYDCKEHIEQTRWYLIPLCCLEQFGRMVKFFHDFCVKNKVFYELYSGSVLGGVKLNGMMPWDLDGDFTFYNRNYTLFVHSKKEFEDFGIILDSFERPRKKKGRRRKKKGRPRKKKGKNGYFKANSPDFYIETWGDDVTSKDLYLPALFKGIPTKMLFHHIWVYTQVSPGLYARNRFGVEVLRHANSWLHLGMKSSWEPYKSGKFLECPEPTHHACENHFSADGSLQFYIP